MATAEKLLYAILPGRGATDLEFQAAVEEHDCTSASIPRRVKPRLLCSNNNGQGSFNPFGIFGYFQTVTYSVHSSFDSSMGFE